jgi:imidazolonepropionase-like amidohydrolase
VNARKTLDAGFTTVRNLGDDDGVTLALRDAIATGKVPGPRIIDAASSISTTSGHMDSTLGLREDLHAAIGQDNLCDGPDDCRRAVRNQVRRGADVIKIATTGGVNSRIGAGLGKQMFEDEAKAIVETGAASTARRSPCTPRRGRHQDRAAGRRPLHRARHHPRRRDHRCSSAPAPTTCRPCRR